MNVKQLIPWTTAFENAVSDFFKKQIGAFKRHPNRCKILMENNIYIYGTKIICNLNINLKININKYTKK